MGNRFPLMHSDQHSSLWEYCQQSIYGIWRYWFAVWILWYM